MARVQVSWIAADGELQKKLGMTEDRSKVGMGICLHNAIPVGTVVELRLPSGTRQGVVRRCCSSRGEFLIGIEFDDAPSPSSHSPAAQKPVVEDRRD